jgi:hypothetical protein
MYPLNPVSTSVREQHVTLFRHQVTGDIGHVCVPGRSTTRTVTLPSGHIVPVLAVPHPRGVHGWETGRLAEAAVDALPGRLLRQSTSD